MARTVARKHMKITLGTGLNGIAMSPAMYNRAKINPSGEILAFVICSATANAMHRSEPMLYLFRVCQRLNALLILWRVRIPNI
jgi:hypothetical protein